MIDLDLLNALGDDAIPEMLRLESHMAAQSSVERDAIRGESPYAYPEGSYERLVLFLRGRAEEQGPWYGWTLSRQRAEQALRRSEFFDGFQAKNVIRLQVRLDLQEDIGLLILDYDAPGLSGSQGTSHADRSLIGRGERCDFALCRQDFSGRADAVPLTLRFTIVSEYVDPNFDNLYPAELVLPLEPIMLEAAYGRSFDLLISGSRASGYRAQLME